MHMIIAKWTILEGKRTKAIAALKILEKEVRTKEPFVLMYTINTPDFQMTNFPTPPENEVIFVSVFASKQAFQKHLNGPIFQNWLKKYKGLFLTNNDNLFVLAEWLKREVGYVRPQMVTE